MAWSAGARDDRIKSAIAVVLCHLLLGYALIAGLKGDIVHRIDATLQVFTLPAERPPPPPARVVRARKASEAQRDAPAPPARTARSSAVVAPPPTLPLPPPPVVIAPSAGAGAEAATGAAQRGAGSGAGGMGAGSGGGGSGSGAQLTSGRIVDADYPRAARKAKAEGSVVVRLVVGGDGRVGDCTLIRSSGNAELDAVTCRLIERRFRYAPAHDAAGRAVSEVKGWRQTWWLEPRTH